MWRLTFLLLLGSQAHLGAAQFGFDLASQIFKQVNENIKGTHEKIQSQMAQNMAAAGSTAILFPGFPFFGNMNNLGNQISDNIQKQLAPLHNLGATIAENVNKQLAPVRAMAIQSSMANGMGGTTIATYRGNRPRVFVIKDGIRQICNGQVDGPNCFGSLEPFQVRANEDFCYTRSHATINNQICLSAGSISVQAINSDVKCYADGAPLLQLSMQEYQQLCGNAGPGKVNYKYYPDPNDPRAIPVPSSNPHVKCLNASPGMCEFEGSDALGGSGSTIISNGNGGSIISSSNGFNINYHNF